VVIVILNVHRAACVSGHTAFMHFGELVEFGKTEQIFPNPTERATEDCVTCRFG
jgi:phosphate transport system ATP-binding protein